MKNIILISLLIVGLAARGQNVLRVNNIPGINVPYSTIQAAVNAASAGDVILVEGSLLTYDAAVINLTKKLTIRGPGFFLSENTTIQVNQNPANSFAFSFLPGSDGSTVSGMTCSYIDVKTSNITISNNRIGIDMTLTNTIAASNLLITGNYIGRNLVGSGPIFTNVIVSNNYLVQAIVWSSGLVSGTIKNNVIQSGFNNLSNCDVVNNIFLDISANTINNTINTTIRNNIFASSQANADATNIFNAATANLFLGLAGHTTDTQWMLKAGSVAIGAGALGEDCGMYGGVTPYKISGVGAGLSTITSFNVPASVPQNGLLNVKVSAKVN